jgi:hypothetical protein
VVKLRRRCWKQALVSYYQLCACTRALGILLCEKVAAVPLPMSPDYHGGLRLRLLLCRWESVHESYVQVRSGDFQALPRMNAEHIHQVLTEHKEREYEPRL